MRFLSSLILILGLCTGLTSAQQHASAGADLPAEKDVTRVESFLASDALKGRKTFSPDIEKASGFIENEFLRAGLKPYAGNSYRQEFFMYTVKRGHSSLSVNGNPVDQEAFLVVSDRSQLTIRSVDSFKVVQIRKGDDLQASSKLIRTYLLSAQEHSMVLFQLDSSFSPLLKRLKLRNMNSLHQTGNVFIFLLGSPPVRTLEVTAENTLLKQSLNNVAAVLPGTDKASEYVIFSAHYDHLGTGANPSAMRQPEAGKDSIFNGANDDASGTTAVIELAHYFARKHDNRRSLLFVTFTAEEIGEYGSQYFSSGVDAKKVVAMFNIEMIGTQSKWATNSAYITGYERSDFGKILQKNLQGSAFHFYPDPYPSQNLFYRSDNAQLALKGVPSHTISTSKMDDEHNYHTPQDEISTLDLPNMTRIIDAIALSAGSIIDGKDTPARVSVEKN